MHTRLWHLKEAPIPSVISIFQSLRLKIVKKKISWELTTERHLHTLDRMALPELE